jgi:hypothetical protein
MKKPVLAMFVVAAIAIGLLAILLVGLLRVDEDGRSRDGAPPLGSELTRATGVTAAGYQAA